MTIHHAFKLACHATISVAFIAIIDGPNLFQSGGTSGEQNSLFLHNPRL